MEKIPKNSIAGKFANKLLVTQRLAHNVGFEGGGPGWREDKI